MTKQPSPENSFLADHVAHLVDSHLRLTGRPLINLKASPENVAEAVFNAEFVVLSSGTEADPLFNYANRCALELFEFGWDDLITLPARESAEAVNQNERAKLMQQVIDSGCIENYAGVRVSASGRRFMIEQATVWNVHSNDGALLGQAAAFSLWHDV